MYTMWLLLLLAICLVSGEEICNKKTKYECECNNCHQLFHTQNLSMVIEFEECNNASLIDFNALRSKLAVWIREECAFILRCNRSSSHLRSSNVLVTELYCLEGLTSRVNVLVVWDDTKSWDSADNAVPVDTLESVLRAREHLLAAQLHSTLLQIGPGSLLTHSRERNQNTWNQIALIALISALCSFIFCGTLAFCVLVNIMGWTRMLQSCCQSRETKTLQELNELNQRNRQMNLAEFEDD